MSEGENGRRNGATLYETRVAAGLSAALRRASHHAAWSLDAPRRFDALSERLVVLSDMHRGKRDRADEFRQCEQAYVTALDHYFSNGYTLAVLGDAEELWKTKARHVVAAYPEVYAREAAFQQEGRLLRFWGNHDEEWASPALVQHELGRAFDADPPEVGEALLLEVTLGDRALGSLFLVHGHQGTGLSDTLAFLARATVRFLWKPIQHVTQVSRNRPSTNRRIREKHNRAMHRWSQAQEKLLLITGHTHRPVFASISILDELERRLGIDIDEISKRVDDSGYWDEVVADCVERGWLGDAAPCGPPAPPDRAAMEPCLFNSGCCCFKSGRINAIEIGGGEIRLVLWSPTSHGPRRVIARAPLEKVYDRIS
jgi:UDP-2,3-diacylglucosamine pyrophosphatase LpxH